MHLITPFKCMLTLALHLPCNWRPQNGTMNKAERAERTPPVLPLQNAEHAASGIGSYCFCGIGSYCATGLDPADGAVGSNSKYATHN